MTRLTIVNPKAFDEKLRQAAETSPQPILDEIRRFLTTAEDVQLYGINPYRFAAPRKLDRMATLKTFLHLTERGLFNLSWVVHCPSCKGMTQQTDKLASLKHGGHCGFCRVEFSAAFDKNIEVTFGVNPAVLKPADVDGFWRMVSAFETEPGISLSLDRGERHYLKTDLKPGNYLLLIPEDSKGFNIVVTEEPAPQPQKLTLDHRDDQAPLVIQLAGAGPAEIVIVNHTGATRDMRWARNLPAAWPSAAVVSSLQEFRDLFSSEMLSLDETFSIESLGFLFTDIKGSTELYERLGDAQAFALVKEHFRIMERIVRDHSGAVVKTIGDAVMAVFIDPRAALRSAVEMIEAFEDLETARKLKNAIVIKVGVHYGPCIAVTLNDRLDYFGTTVNIAARVQGLSDGRDIMASGAAFTQGDGESCLRERSWRSDSFVTSLKGLKASYEVHKLFRPGA